MPTSTGRFGTYSPYVSYPSMYRSSSALTSSYYSRPISLDRSSYLSSRSTGGSSYGTSGSSYRYSDSGKTSSASSSRVRPIYSSLTDTYRSSRSVRASPSRTSYDRDSYTSSSTLASSYYPRASSKSRDSGYDSLSKDRSLYSYDSSSRRNSLIGRDSEAEDDDNDEILRQKARHTERVRAYESWRDQTEERIAQRRRRLGLSPGGDISSRSYYSGRRSSSQSASKDDDDEGRTQERPSVTDLCRRYQTSLNVSSTAATNGSGGDDDPPTSTGCSGGSGTRLIVPSSLPSVEGSGIKPSRSRLNSYNNNEGEDDEGEGESWKKSSSSSNIRAHRPKSPCTTTSTINNINNNNTESTYQKISNKTSSSTSERDAKSAINSSLGTETTYRYRDRKERLRERIALRLSNELENEGGSTGEKDTKTKGLTGLRNIGNTCFMNSIIQCLSNTRCLLEYILQDGYASDINTTLSTMKGSLVKAFGSLLREMWVEGGSSSPVNTGAFKAQVQRFASVFIGYAQHDAQEFLRKLLEGLHEDVNRVTMKPKPLVEDIDESLDDNQKAMEAWKRYIRLDDSKIVDMFVGQLKSSLQCSLCGHISVTFDPFWDLSLPIPQRSGQVKLSQCLDLFTKEEVLDGDERPTCSNCKERRKMTKSFSIQKFPKVLVLHLKRFSPHERWRGKLTCMVEFPLDTLDLSRYAACSSICSQYRLISVANHSGTALSGHYTAYCRHPYIQKWHEYNDSRVSSINPNRVCSVEAYVLFYELSS